MYGKPTGQRRYRKGPETTFQGQRIGPFASACSRTDHRLLHTAHVMSMDNSSRTQNAFELWTETQLSEMPKVSVCLPDAATASLLPKSAGRRTDGSEPSRAEPSRAEAEAEAEVIVSVWLNLAAVGRRSAICVRRVEHEETGAGCPPQPPPPAILRTSACSAGRPLAEPS